MGKGQSPKINGAGKTGYPQAKEWRWNLTLLKYKKLIQNRSKSQTKELKLKLKEENRGGSFLDVESGNEFLYKTPKVQAIKEKDKEDLIKIKNFCTSNSTIKRSKRQPTEWRKYLQSMYLTRD